MKLSFVGHTTEQPVISQIIKQYDIVVNIVHGKIATTASGSLGTLYIHIDGSADQVAAALNFLVQHEVQTEVIEHV